MREHCTSCTSLYYVHTCTLFHLLQMFSITSLCRLFSHCLLLNAPATVFCFCPHKAHWLHSLLCLQSHPILIATKYMTLFLKHCDLPLSQLLQTWIFSPSLNIIFTYMKAYLLQILNLFTFSRQKIFCTSVQFHKKVRNYINVFFVKTGNPCYH